MVENRDGASGNIATEAVVNAAPDGYTLLTVASANTINPALYHDLNFNFVRDIAPVAGLLRVPLVLLVNPSFPATTFAEFLAYAKAHPGTINIATPGKGTPMHVGVDLLKMMSGIDIVEVPYRGPAPARSARRAGAGFHHHRAGVIRLREGRHNCGRWRCSARHGSTSLAGHADDRRIRARL